MPTVKLSKTQVELLAQLQAGAVLHYQRYMGRFNPTPYYFCSADMRRCTKAAEALIEKGLVIRHKAHHYSDPTFSLSESGKSFPTS